MAENLRVAAQEEECTICLEPITKTSILGVISNCHHYYHDKCLLQWSANSNSCPTCRKKFYKIENIDCQNPHKITSTVAVKDKLLSNDAINEIPEEFIIRPHQQYTSIHLSGVNDRESPNGVCSICSSADYRLSRTRNMISCQICASMFHLVCLGISADSANDIEEWFCPMCDSPQELLVLAAPSSNGSRVRYRRSAPYRSTGSSGTQTLSIRPTTGLSTGRQTTTLRNSRPGLVIRNENNELDDDFLYSEDFSEDFHTHFNSNSGLSTGFRNHPSSPIATPVVNGGVLLRREMRNNQNLTEDEAQSWNLFEEARRSSNSELPQSSNPSNSINGERKKRRKRTVNNDDKVSVGPSQSIQQTGGSSSSGSRIASLISQIKTPSKPVAISRSDNSSSFSIPEEMNANSSPSSISASQLPSVYSPTDARSLDSDYQTDSESSIGSRSKKKICPNDNHKSTIGTPELTFDQKNEIQKHIRNYLRPLYKPRRSNGKSSANQIIKSEDAYMNINKGISRKLYSAILSDATIENGRYIQKTIDDYFENESKLKQLVDKYVEDELTTLRNA